MSASSAAPSRSAARHTTVPALLAEALASIAGDLLDEPRLPPLTRRALGLARGIPDRPVKDLLAEALDADEGGRQ